MRIGRRTYIERGVTTQCGRVWMTYLESEAKQHVDEMMCGPLEPCWIIFRLPKEPAG